MSGTTLSSPHQLNAGPILNAIDSISATRSRSCYLSMNGQMRKLRAPRNAGTTVMIELRPPAGANSNVLPRGPKTSPLNEWLNMGLDCGGAAITWVGVGGAAAAAPESGGLTGVGAAFLYGGALASSAQCGVSLVRVANVSFGGQGLNAAMDQSRMYRTVMYSLDAVSLASVGSDLYRSGSVLDAASKLKLLTYISDGVGVAASAAEPGGVLHDSVVWFIRQIGRAK